MTTTCLPVAHGSGSATLSPATTLFCCGRNSIAKWTPSSSRPGTGRSRGCSAPPASTTASNSSQRRRMARRPLRRRRADVPTYAGAELDALGRHLLHAAVDQVLLHLEVGNAVAQQAADAIVLLEHARRRGRRARAAARRRGPPGPSRRPRRACRSCAAGGCGTTQPSSQRLVDDACSIDLMPTGSSLMFSVQAASHGAGQMRPVNSGKLLVECSTSSAVLPVAAGKRGRCSRE